MQVRSNKVQDGLSSRGGGGEGSWNWEEGEVLGGWNIGRRKGDENWVLGRG